jgi:hypothetical protein
MLALPAEVYGKAKSWQGRSGFREGWVYRYWPAEIAWVSLKEALNDGSPESFRAG